MEKSQNTKLIKELANKYGFSRVGFSEACKLEEQEESLNRWLNNDYHGEMHYMANHFSKRLDPRKLVDGAKSVISFAYNYYTSVDKDDNNYKVSKYAYGRDYHKVVKKKIQQLIKEFETSFGSVNGRIFVDSAPVMERVWAAKSGIGWVGKNTLLIHPKMGSYFFLAEIISDIEVNQDQPISDFCGTCTKCIDACPTKAIDRSGYIMDGSKCISYATIELNKDKPIPELFKGNMENWIFGCDICQEVCPWNRFSTQHKEEDFIPKSDFLSWSKSDWNNLTQEKFDEVFFNSPIKRTKFDGIKRNINFV